MFFWCKRWRRGPWQNSNGIACWRGAKNRRELSSTLHWRARLRIQRQQLSSRDTTVYASRGRFYKPQRNRRKIHLRRSISWRELHVEARRSWNVEHGQRWTRHKWISVLHLHDCYRLVGWRARSIRICNRRYGSSWGYWNTWVKKRTDFEEIGDRRLRTALDSYKEYGGLIPSIFHSKLKPLIIEWFFAPISERRWHPVYSFYATTPMRAYSYFIPCIWGSVSMRLWLYVYVYL